jgi:hypothetical protein
VSFDIDQANQKFNTFFEEVKKSSVQLNDDDDKKMRYRYKSPGLRIRIRIRICMDPH